MIRQTSPEPDFLHGIDKNGVDNPDYLSCLACGKPVWIPEADRHIWGKWRGAYYADVSKCTYEIGVAYWRHARRCFALKRMLVRMRMENPEMFE